MWFLDMTYLSHTLYEFLNFLTFKNQRIIQRSLEFWLLLKSSKVFSVSLGPVSLTMHNS